jgi:signal transduction histidine kinase
MKESIYNMIHQIRTPAVSIKIGAEGVKHYLPLLITSYKLAKEKGIKLPHIEDDSLEILMNVLGDIENLSLLINNLLDNFTEIAGEGEIR